VAGTYTLFLAKPGSEEFLGFISGLSRARQGGLIRRIRFYFKLKSRELSWPRNPLREHDLFIKEVPDSLFGNTSNSYGKR
jgi:hypothetical protein